MYVGPVEKQSFNLAKQRIFTPDQSVALCVPTEPLYSIISLLGFFSYIDLYPAAQAL